MGLAADNAASPNFFDKIPHDKTCKCSKIYIKFGVFAMKPKWHFQGFPIGRNYLKTFRLEGIL